MGRKKKDLTGQKYGRLTVIKENGRSKTGYVLWLCRCECGNLVTVISSNLLTGNTTSCGCRFKETRTYNQRKQREELIKQDIKGKKFGRLTAVSPTNQRKQRSVVWQCLCECGNTKYVSRKDLTNGLVKSCGCLRNRKNSTEIHNKTNSPLYHVWTSMKQRCFNPKACQYKYYGRQGVTVCSEWTESFLSFYHWAIKNGYHEGLTIDRIDTFGNYEPTNCHWTTHAEQNRNKRSNCKNKCNEK